MNNKVFVSSTCYDLVDLRAEIELHIKEMGLSPVMSDSLISEFEISGDTNSIQTCLNNISKCDVFICILSQRYGPTLEKYKFGSKSATHLEYLEAKKLGKRILLYVRDRLDADLSTFNKIKKSEESTPDDEIIKKLSWVQDTKNIRLFEMINDHKELSNDDKHNWYYTFKNSVELKSVISKDLASISSKFILKNLTEKNLLPSLNFKLDEVKHVISEQKIYGKIELCNNSNFMAWDCNINSLEDSIIRFGDISPKNSFWRKFVFSNYGGRSIYLSIKVSFITDLGYKIIDTFEISSNPNEHEIIVSRKSRKLDSFNNVEFLGPNDL